MQFKTTHLQKILGCSAATEAKWLDAINAACAQYSINTKLRLAAFIAQVGHESARLTAVTENLNYSAAGLMKTWPSRFDSAKANACARNPQKIANVVYSNRMGNGNEASGDGWTYRGRGLIQVTGKSMYNAFSQSAGVNAVANPDLLTQVQYAALSAAWFWDSKSLNAYADRSDLLSTTKRINGGTNGQDDREMLYKKALAVLSDEPTPTDEQAAKKADPAPDTTAPVSDQKTPAAQNGSIVEPRASGAGSVYPWNFVYESRSGHYTEVDDTPGAERLNMTHRTGSYWEMNPLGTYTLKSVLDFYKLSKGDSYDYTGGNYSQQVQGQAYRQSSGDMVFTSGGTVFFNVSKVQMNTGMLAISGEVNAGMVNSPMFSGFGGGLAYGDLLAKQALVAYDLIDGDAPMLSGALGFTGGSTGAAGSADSQLSNTLSKKAPNGTPWVTNGVPPSASSSSSGSSGGSSSSGSGGTTVSSSLTLSSTNSNDYDVPQEAGTTFKVSDLANVGAAAAGAAGAVMSLLKNNDADPAVANAMASSVGVLDQQQSSKDNNTPFFLKHVSFDKPVLFSMSVPGMEPDPSLYTNNYHTIVDPVTGVGVLHISNGHSWNQVNDPSAANAYADELVSNATIDYNNKILAEANARNDAISSAILQEATARGAAVTAEATARQSADTSLSNLITTLTASVNDNAAAIQTESQARADAITAEATARQTLASQVDSNTSAITTEQTARSNGDATNAAAIQTVTSRITNGNAAPYAPYITWSFDTGISGWTTVGATASVSSGIVTLTSTSNDPNFISPTISVPGGNYDKIRARVKRTGGSGWDGSIFYTTSGHGFSSSYYSNITPDPGFPDWYIVEWDMVNLTAGGSDWTTHTITQIRIDLGNTNSDVFLVDWVSIGTRSVGVDGYSFATVQTQSSTTATDVNNIKAQWAIKTNVNGAVAGIALVNDLINGNPSSSFTVQADQFKLVSPTNSSLITNPFTVDSNGNAVFAGVITVKSAPSGQRTEITNSAINVYDSSGTLRVRLGVW